jgi:hypothetical protein
MNKQDADSRKLEREVQDIKLFAAREYVTKGEYNQQVAMIVTKLDWFGERIETVLLRMGGAK